MEEGDISVGDVTKGVGAAMKMGKSLPGMTGGKKEEEGSSEPKTCSTCNQRIVTSQPGGAMDTANDAIENADKAMNCCNKLFDCFGKVDDLTEKAGLQGE